MSDYDRISDLVVQGRVVSKVNGKLIGSTSIMPPANEENVGLSILYVGPDGEYLNEKFYTCELIEGVYRWILINTAVLPDLSVYLLREDAKRTYETIENVTQHVTEAEERFKAIEAKDVEQDGRLGSLEGRATDNESRMGRLENRDLEQDKRLNALEGRATSAEGRLDSLEAMDASHNSRLGSLENRMGAVESRNIEQEDKLDALERKDAELDSKIESKASELETRIETVSGELSGDLTEALKNYYLKTETYSAQEIDSMISLIPKFKVEVVSSLPTQGENAVIYLVPKEGSDKDVHNEYIWTGSKYELLGSTELDLSGYYTRDEASSEFSSVRQEISNLQTTVTQVGNKIRYGTSTPSASLGEVGDIYVQYS